MTALAREFEASLVYSEFLSETETVKVRLCLNSLSHIFKCLLKNANSQINKTWVPVRCAWHGL